jgi:hypothetical protein
LLSSSSIHTDDDFRELSNGHFSPDNQKRLNGNPQAADVPIYEAKMTGDLRLVVSCFSETNAEINVP